MKKSALILGAFLIFGNFILASDNDFPIGEVEVINAKKISVSNQKESPVEKKESNASSLENKEKTKLLKKEIVEKSEKNATKKILSKIDNKILEEKESKSSENNVLQTEQSKKEKMVSENKTEGQTEVPKIDLKNYVNIKYNKDLQYFSIIRHNEESYNKVLEKYGINNPYVLKRYINSFGNYKAIIMNALMYDYKYEKPNIAENFYRLFPSLKHGSFYDRKLRFADYLLRTGRPLEISKVLKSGECIAQIKDMYICFYYLGLAKYFESGNNRNRFLRIASQKIKKAKELYKMK